MTSARSRAESIRSWQCPVIKDVKVEYEPLLAVQTCPHWDVFGGGVEDAKKEIENNVR